MDVQYVESFSFSRLLANPKATLESMVRGKVVSLPGHIQATYVHNMLKLYTHIIATAEEEDDAEMIQEVNVTNVTIKPLRVMGFYIKVKSLCQEYYYLCS